MIKIVRTAVKEPDVLSAKDSPGHTERAEAKKFFSARTFRRNMEAGKKFEFKVYKNPEVVRALYDLFKGKCAYCESTYKNTQPPDVEHYRPKGGYLDENGKLKTPGYYWLAAEWSNLLPSCVDCNRGRNVLRDDGEEVRTGKANSFPLEDPKKRAKRVADLKHEKPLLLDPCSGDEPLDHIEFMEDGFVKPRVLNGAPSRHGDTTIVLCGLYRPGLVSKRHDTLVKIRLDMQFARDIKSLVPANPAAQVLLDQALQNLRAKYLSPNQEFLAMARQYIEPFIAEMQAP